MLSDREKILKIWRESADLDPWTLPGPYWQWHLTHGTRRVLLQSENAFEYDLTNYTWKTLIWKALHWNVDPVRTMNGAF